MSGEAVRIEPVCVDEFLRRQNFIQHFQRKGFRVKFRMRSAFLIESPETARRNFDFIFAGFPVFRNIHGEPDSAPVRQSRRPVFLRRKFAEPVGIHAGAAGNDVVIKTDAGIFHRNEFHFADAQPLTEGRLHFEGHHAAPFVFDPVRHLERETFSAQGASFFRLDFGSVRRHDFRQRTAELRFQLHALSSPPLQGHSPFFLTGTADRLC